MLSVFAIAGLALAGGPAVPIEDVSYDRCQVAVLMDTEQGKALAFRVTTDYDIDLENGMPMELREEQYDGSSVLWAQVPFDSMFNAVIFADELGQQMTMGMIMTFYPYRLYMVQGERVDPSLTTIQGLTGYVEVLDGSPMCDLN